MKLMVSRMNQGLSDAMRRRTAAEIGPPVPVILHDELAFFPLLYWPVDDRHICRIRYGLNRYLRNGGTIVFDSRDQQTTNSPVRVNALRRLANGLNIPPLVPVPPNHVLTKAFYLMQDFPGRWSSGRVWVEASENRSNDGVSRVIVGGHDWAGAWSVDDHGRNVFPIVPGGEKQREMAYRFGVNLVMYALTGTRRIRCTTVDPGTARAKTMNALSIDFAPLAASGSCSCRCGDCHRHSSQRCDTCARSDLADRCGNLPRRDYARPTLVSELREPLKDVVPSDGPDPEYQSRDGALILIWRYLICEAASIGMRRRWMCRR